MANCQGIIHRSGTRVPADDHGAEKKKGMNETDWTTALLKGLLPQERRKRGWSRESETGFEYEEVVRTHSASRSLL